MDIKTLRKVSKLLNTYEFLEIYSTSCEELLRLVKKEENNTRKLVKDLLKFIFVGRRACLLGT
jgi:hypothetical protein